MPPCFLRRHLFLINHNVLSNGEEAKAESQFSQRWPQSHCRCSFDACLCSCTTARSSSMQIDAHPLKGFAIFVLKGQSTGMLTLSPHVSSAAQQRLRDIAQSPTLWHKSGIEEVCQRRSYHKIVNSPSSCHQDYRQLASILLTRGHKRQIT